MIQFTEDEFLKAHGVLLGTHPVLAGGDNPTGNVPRWISNVCNFVEDYIKSYQPSFSSNSLTPSSQQRLKEAMMIQGVYVLLNGYPEMYSGYDSISNTVVNKDELDKRAMSPIAKRKLLTGGFLYRGL